MWLNLAPIYEFEDRSGIVRQTAGCSVAGHFEFRAGLSRLWELMAESDGQRPWPELYRAGGEFRHTIDRLLELNGLSPHWFTISQISSLLFQSVGADGAVNQGHLVQINTLPAGEESDDSGDSVTIATIIANLHQDLAKAVEIADNLPIQALGPILAAKAEAMLSPEDRAKAQQQKELDDMANDPAILELLYQ